MLIFQKHNLAYLAVPKTGSTSIELALDLHASSALRDPPGLKHINARRFEREFRPLFQRKSAGSLKTMAIIREPISWLESWYRYRGRAAIAGKSNSTSQISFDKFVEAYLLEDRESFANVGSQAQFISDAAGKIIVSHLFQYEQMDQFIRFCESQFGTKISLPYVNKSPNRILKLAPDLKSALEEKLLPDIELHKSLSDGPILDAY